MVVGNSPDPFRLAVCLALFSGAGVMALEVLALPMIDLSVPLSFYPPAAILFCVILLLALAAAAVKVRKNITSDFWREGKVSDVKDFSRRRFSAWRFV